MASTYATDQSSAKNARKGLGLVARTVTYTSPVFVLDDVVQLLPVYEGETVVGLELVTSDLDSHGTPALVLDVGDGDNDDRYILGSTVGQAGGVAGPNVVSGYPYTYTADDTIDLHVDTAPATGAAGTVSLTVYVLSA